MADNTRMTLKPDEIPVLDAAATVFAALVTGKDTGGEAEQVLIERSARIAIRMAAQVNKALDNSAKIMAPPESGAQFKPFG